MHVTDSQTLRQHLMAPDPMLRLLGLHALERELERHPAGALINEIARFAARGIPYYSLSDPHFMEWVGKAVAYWERLHGGPKMPPPLERTRTVVPRRVGP